MPISLSISSPATSNFDLLRFLLVVLGARSVWLDCESVLCSVLTELEAVPSSEVLKERLD